MRWKIIVVNAGIVFVLGLLAFVLLVPALNDRLSNPTSSKAEVLRAVTAADARIAYDAVRSQDWLNRRVSDAELRAVFGRGTASARQQAASTQANRVHDDALSEPGLSTVPPALVMLVDAQGIVLGRNGSQLMRGDQIAEAYPGFASSLKRGVAGSGVWLSRERQEQLLVSFAPVRTETGGLLGALVMGTPLNDDWLARTSELTSGAELRLALLDAGQLEWVARGGEPEATAIAGSDSRVVSAARTAVESGRTVFVEGIHAGRVLAARAIEGDARTHSAVLIASRRVARSDVTAIVLKPLIGVVLLGLALVVFAGWLLGNYYSRPVSELEDGLLAIINGDSNVRFQIEHPDLGGLVFRINSLLNALTGVPEDTTDAQGRPSTPSNATDFVDELAVEGASATAQGVAPAMASRLAQEPEQEYRARLFREYIEAKRSIGDPAEHITEEAFFARLGESAAALSRGGRAVRFRVEERDGTIKLLAVPLPGADG